MENTLILGQIAFKMVQISAKYLDKFYNLKAKPPFNGYFNGYFNKQPKGTPFGLILKLHSKWLI